MTLSFIRVFFTIVCGVVGYYVGSLLDVQFPNAGINITIMATMVGLVSALILIYAEMRLRNVSFRGLSSVVFGLLLGILMAKLMANIFRLLPMSDFVRSITEIILTLVFSYLGAVMALRGKDEFNIIIPYVRFKRQEIGDTAILVDTSALIDGRLMNIYLSHFVNGRLVIIRSVLHELQDLADSSNEIKRDKGKRGLDNLQKIQNNSKIEISIHEDDAQEEMSVDAKLIMNAKLMDAQICTTDHNLSRVAAAQGIVVLNVHELAEAVKSVIFVGDIIDVKLIKEGKEPDQAVGFLEDGAMIVVGSGKSHIGQKVKTCVTSVIQTQSGRIIFASLTGQPG